MSDLKISAQLSLPLEAATQTFGILAQRRKGKTYTANVVAEEMHKAGIPWVALDPTGAWWGLRSSADGKKPGLPVIVFGGDHGDLPLERHAGAMIADLVIEHPGWYILDFSHFESKEAERQLATDFAERFYRRKGINKAPMHLFVDEADMFAPQQAPSGDKRMLGAFESIVRRGGIRGIGTTLITQRAAVLNKNVLEQIDVLIALRTVGPNDRKAIAGYVDAFATPEQQSELMGSIASLDLGEAWVWEPGADLFKRVKIRKRETFNSSATPKTGDVPQAMVTLAKVDLEKLRDQMAATIEQAKSDDPKELKAQIEVLKRQLADQEPQVEMHQVEVMPARLQELIDHMPGVLQGVQSMCDAIIAEAAKYAPSDGQLQPTYTVDQKLVGDDTPMRGITKRAVMKGFGPAVDGQYDTKKNADGSLTLSAPLSKAGRTILSVLAQWQPMGRTKVQISILSGYSKKSSSFSNALGELRSRGYITPAGTEPIHITTTGYEAVGEVEKLPRGLDLFHHWQGNLDKAASIFLGALYAAYPAALNYDELQDRTGYSRTSSSFSNALGKLRSLELVTKSNPVKASDVFFEGQA